MADGLIAAGPVGDHRAALEPGKIWWKLCCGWGCGGLGPAKMRLMPEALRMYFPGRWEAALMPC